MLHSGDHRLKRLLSNLFQLERIFFSVVKYQTVGNHFNNVPTACCMSDKAEVYDVITGGGEQPDSITV